MSSFLTLIKAARKSRTLQFNGGLLAAIAAVLNSEALQAIIANNPQAVTYVGLAATIINILLRAKTDKSLADRAND